MFLGKFGVWNNLEFLKFSVGGSRSQGFQKYLKLEAVRSSPGSGSSQGRKSPSKVLSSGPAENGQAALCKPVTMATFS